MPLNINTIGLGKKYKVQDTEHTRKWNKRFIGKIGICKWASSVSGAKLVFNLNDSVVPLDALIEI